MNPLVQPIAAELRDGGKALLDAGVETIDGVANDIAMRGRRRARLRRASRSRRRMSLMDAPRGRRGRPLARSRARRWCSRAARTTSSRRTTPSSSSGSVAGPVEHVWLERSFHVATLDYDAALIEAETGRFLDAAFDGR